MKNVTKPLLVTPPPHLSDGTRIPTIMWSVSLSLLPALGWGVFIFGWQALLTVTVSIATAMITELIVNYIRRTLTIFDGSAFLTGLLLGLSLPPSVPLYVPIIAAVFAIGLVKHAFGGLGANWMNPALAGRVFVLFSFSHVMQLWQRPATLPVWKIPGMAVDAVSGATPLGTMKILMAETAATASSHEALVTRLQALGGPLPLLEARQYPVTSFDAQISQGLGDILGVHIPKGYVDLLAGNVAGAIGEVSVLLLLVGVLFLLLRKIISWEIPVSFLGSFALFVWLFGGIPFYSGLFHGDVLFHLATGGVVFGACYFATDSVTSPLSRPGKILFGIGAGVLTFLIRCYGSLPEGVSLAIILMNIFVPLIDRILKPKRRGMRRGKCSEKNL